MTETLSKKQFTGAGDMAHWLRILAALAEDPGSLPSIHTATLTPVQKDVKFSFNFLPGSCERVVHINSFRNTHTHTFKN